MASFTIKQGDNFGTTDNDFFHHNSNIESFNLDGGDGYDTLRINVAFLTQRNVDNVERFEFYGTWQKAQNFAFGMAGRPVFVDFSEANIRTSVYVYSSNSTVIGNGAISLGATGNSQIRYFDMESGVYRGVYEERQIENTYKKFNVVSAQYNDDPVFGNQFNNIAILGSGKNYFDGRGGLDTVRIQGCPPAYKIEKTANGHLISLERSVTPQSTELVSVERVEFTCYGVKILAFDLEGAAGQTYRLYQAAFARTPDTDGLRHNVKLVDAGMTMNQMSSAFLGSAEFIQRYGRNTSDSAYINALYNNVLGRDAESAGLAGWIERLSSGTWDRASVLIGFSESAENKALVGPAIENGIWLL
ncbi:DUF4214 domain-containing protein [Pannonibacter sp. SL95]|uniref:DUF4214 domain-containing protein n=1 Tax=Pannonibacter sp. SL95 TaxID=2995153 RepID=UPI0022765B30|nr:DUF4214 domain-containing protein [Pannonibacter sp. SL95]MCY1706367.1 DUF4214 domain-containing protein [Pannonibacter sp. SL95]